MSTINLKVDTSKIIKYMPLQYKKIEGCQVENKHSLPTYEIVWEGSNASIGSAFGESNAKLFSNSDKMLELLEHFVDDQNGLASIQEYIFKVEEARLLIEKIKS